MKVIWSASEASRGRAYSDGATFATDSQVFFAEFDFVSIHVRLKPETYGIITSDDLMRMRSSATLVDTSRSGLVELCALEQALDVGRPGRLALDVADVEPLANTADPVISHPSVISTPHIGYVTEDELDMQFSDIYDQINDYTSGAPNHMINPTVWQDK